MGQTIRRRGRPPVGQKAKQLPVREAVDVVGLLHEMKERLAADFGFRRINLAGVSHLNRSTEPVSLFLIWLENTPEAQTALEGLLAQWKAGCAFG
jgi:hypothetical protein